MNSDLANFQFYDKYSNWLHDEGRRETFEEACQRCVDFARFTTIDKLGPSVYNELLEGMMTMGAFPSMRYFQVAGPEAIRHPQSIFNCAYHPVRDISAFSETLFLLGLGIGVGYSVEKKYINCLPEVVSYDQWLSGGNKEIVVEDSLEGWAHSLQQALTFWWNGIDPKFNFSKVRPAGSPLKSRGGYASGPRPFEIALGQIREIILGATGRHLKPIEVHDIQCHIASAIVSGGFRRSAMISLFDNRDTEMFAAKSGEWYKDNPQRSYANNSMVLTRPMTEWWWRKKMHEIHDTGYGEPGIFSRYAASESRPARRLDADWGTNPCVTGDTLVAVADGRLPTPIIDLVKEGKDVDVYTVSKEGELTIRKARNFRKTGTGTPVYRVTWTDGSHINVTANHKFVTKDGREVEALNLKPTDEIDSLTIGGYRKGKAHFESCDVDEAYRQLWHSKMTKSEHRFIAGFHNNCQIVGLNDLQVHHIDRDSRNNSLSNLQIMSSKEHAALHRDRMLGENNPANTHMTDEWKENLSKACTGEANGNSTGHINEEIHASMTAETERLGRIMGKADWVKFAKENGLPVNLNEWRRGGLTLSELLKEIAVNSELPVFEEDGQLFVIRVCEVCGNEFAVPYRRREAAVCGRSCGNVKSWQRYGEQKRLALLEGYEQRHQGVRADQMRVYNDLLVGLDRHPTKKEWYEECKERGLSAEIARTSSPFRSFKALQEGASVYNHRVASVEYVGEEDVYTCTVDDTHTYFTGSMKKTKGGFRSFSGVLSRQCGEIFLRPYSFCNLSIANVRAEDDYAEIANKARLAAIWGTIQASFGNFPSIRKEWSVNQVEERLLGVDLNGQRDNAMFSDSNSAAKFPFGDIVQLVNKTNVEIASKLGIRPAAASTCAKPAGNSSVLFDTASGIRPRHSEFYIRRVQVLSSSPMAAFLIDSGVPHVNLTGGEWASEATYVFDFPVQAPSTASAFVGDIGVEEQLAYWKVVKTQYTEHNPSVTIDYRTNKDIVAIGKWLTENQTIIGGLSFFPYSDVLYDNAPYESVTEEVYEELVSKVNVDWSRYKDFDHYYTTSSQEFACVGGACDVTY
jgi:hypothetical protein